MSHEERERARENYKKFKAMTPEQRQQIIQQTSVVKQQQPAPAAGKKR